MLHNAGEKSSSRAAPQERPPIKIYVCGPMAAVTPILPEHVTRALQYTVRSPGSLCDPRPDAGRVCSTEPGPG
jgi:hypothetical protein